MLSDLIGVVSIDVSSALSFSEEGKEFDLPLDPAGSGNIQFKMRVTPPILPMRSSVADFSKKSPD